MGVLLTFTTPAALAAPAAAPAQDARGPVATKSDASLTVRSVRRNVVAGRAVLVKGALRPAGARRRVLLQARGSQGWVTVDRGRTRTDGRYRLTYRRSRPGSARLRVRFTGDRQLRAQRRAVGRTNVFRRAYASWYGPGLYGNPLGCGGTLGAGTIGVAHKTLPCGTRLTIRYGGRAVRARVIDRGPYVGGREFDLTSATKDRLGFRGHGWVLVTR
jgi:hypothetical protein